MKVVYGVFVALALMLAPAFAEEAPVCEGDQSIVKLEEALVQAELEFVKLEGEELEKFAAAVEAKTGNAKPDEITTVVIVYLKDLPFVNVGFFKEDGCFYGQGRWPRAIVDAVMKEVRGQGV